ncbi:hypothetical protein [Marinobacter oulmenensis]|uniref:Uncharacterized protein n=1 Tax=Marinobacter oulmenensis TaxID=643747 RepID=A0A840UEN0_9GAMM|nr:hypothetical protein [Marinobacter oulmenensis]MBB5321171.1 hypothetical protein [Marinobacter oulmenensis]
MSIFFKRVILSFFVIFPGFSLAGIDFEGCHESISEAKAIVDESIAFFSSEDFEFTMLEDGGSASTVIKKLNDELSFIEECSEAGRYLHEVDNYVPSIAVKRKFFVSEIERQKAIDEHLRSVDLILYTLKDIMSDLSSMSR